MSVMLEQNKITPDRRVELDRILGDDMVLGEMYWQDFNQHSKDCLRVTLNSMLNTGINPDAAGSWIYSIATAVKTEY